MAERLPPEIWWYIFDLAADEDTIFYPGLQTSMAQSTWSKSLWGGWTVRTPHDTINIIQRRSYATKKVSSSLPLFSVSLREIAHRVFSFFLTVDHRGLPNVAQTWHRVSRPLSLL